MIDSITLVISSQRSGSTLLCRDIESLAGMGLPKEYFTYFFKKRQRVKELLGKYSESDVISMIQKGCISSHPNIGAVKLMVDQAPKVDSLIRQDAAVDNEIAIDNIITWAFNKFSRVNLIFLTRNVIDQAISRAISKHSDIWHYELDGTRRKNERWVDKRPDYNLNLSQEEISMMVISELPDVVLHSGIIKRLAKKYSKESILIDYESLISNPEGCWKQLIFHAKKFGFAPPNQKAKRTLRKLISPEMNIDIKQGLKSYLLTNINL
ncbi:Stf0 family sulfotransferase [Prochlorococcus marinus]|nr:Stf0 family sulfotransferase [Prochlorococcus marinus]